ncbi:EAL domain-containing protein [Brucella pseudogrignonensis]|uniref:EAL domain-containing protein (Putative c-di-GMP-specific phosphodiesterase class I) n=1 Tax=Brucella pseudogrignonensis TaxID=419475 RepID=A0ABU1MFH3_9HYPH|nr:EAL domain-containing protein [Brucella pseudogrignonensis]MDR6434658.1 EAL domain-containing protein (putative c-di-GMP-specific phosphodiesterase class I) [Brucella pseudogrignonensis]
MPSSEHLSWENGIIAAIEEQPIAAEIQAVHGINDVDNILYGDVLPLIHNTSSQLIPVEDVKSFLELIGKCPILDLKVIERILDELKNDRFAVLGYNISSDCLVETDPWQKLYSYLIKNEPFIDRLFLQVSETRPLGNAFGLKRKIHQLRRMGVRIGIENFGSGYITPLRLLDLDVDLIKIDPSFVRNHLEKVASLESIIQFATSVAPIVVVNGIETDQQYSLIKELKASHGQGSYFSQPIRFDSVDAYPEKISIKS